MRRHNRCGDAADAAAVRGYSRGCMDSDGPAGVLPRRGGRCGQCAAPSADVPFIAWLRWRRATGGPGSGKTAPHLWGVRWGVSRRREGSSTCLRTSPTQQQAPWHRDGSAQRPVGTIAVLIAWCQTVCQVLPDMQRLSGRLSSRDPLPPRSCAVATRRLTCTLFSVDTTAVFCNLVSSCASAASDMQRLSGPLSMIQLW